MELSCLKRGLIYGDNKTAILTVSMLLGKLFGCSRSYQGYLKDLCLVKSHSLTVTRVLETGKR